MHKIRILLVVEMETETADPNEVRRKLDDFREETLPAANWGLVIYEATQQDIMDLTELKPTPSIQPKLKRQRRR